MINYTRRILLTLSLILGSFTAVSDEPVKVGVLDWQQLFTKSPQAEEAGKRLEREFQGAKDRLINKQKEYQAKREKLQRDKDVMSSTENSKKEKELAKIEQDLRRMDEELRADYSARHREETDEFVKLVREVAEKLAMDEKYDLVIPQEATVFVSDRIDLTDKIMTKLAEVKSKTLEKKDVKSDKKN